MATFFVMVTSLEIVFLSSPDFGEFLSSPKNDDILEIIFLSSPDNDDRSTTMVDNWGRWVSCHPASFKQVDNIG